VNGYRNVSKENPDKRKTLLALWDRYVKENGVIVTGDGMFQQRASAPMPKNH
jgi:hypothetical protein